MIEAIRRHFEQALDCEENEEHNLGSANKTKVHRDQFNEKGAIPLSSTLNSPRQLIDFLLLQWVFSREQQTVDNDENSHREVVELDGQSIGMTLGQGKAFGFKCRLVHWVGIIRITKTEPTRSSNDCRDIMSLGGKRK